MLRVMVWAPKVLPGPHPLVDMDSSLTFASPVIARYPLMLQLGGLLLKETPTIPEWPQMGIEPTIFGLEGRFPDHLATHMHARTHADTHTHTHIRLSLMKTVKL